MAKTKIVKGLVNNADKPPKRVFAPKVIVGFCCILLAVFIGYGLPLIVQNSKEEETEVVVTRKQIAKGEEIRAESVSTLKVKKDELLSTYFYDMSAVVGQYAQSDIQIGSLLNDIVISTKQPESNSYLKDIPEGKSAIAVTIITAAGSVAKKIEAGDIVTIYGIPPNEGMSFTAWATSYPEIEYVRVLSTITGGDEVAKETEETQTTAEKDTTITLLVDKLQARLLSGLNNNAIIHMALASRGDEQKAKDMLSKQETYNKKIIMTPIAVGEVNE